MKFFARYTNKTQNLEKVILTLVIAVMSRRGVLGYQEGNKLLEARPLLRVELPTGGVFSLSGAEIPNALGPRLIAVLGVLKLLGASPPPRPQIPSGL